MEEKKPRDYTIEVVDNAVTILLALGVPEYIQLSLKEIATTLNISHNVTFRVLKTLEKRQLVEEVNGKWQVAPAVTRFAEGFRRHVAARKSELSRIEKDHLEVNA
jgi:DNA-binding IclR family transcriptional regulator